MQWSPFVGQIGSSGLTKVVVKVNDVGAGEGPIERGGDVDESNEEFVMWKSWTLHKMELIRPQVKYTMKCPWEEELKVLVSGGVFMELREEVSFIKFSRMVW